MKNTMSLGVIEQLTHCTVRIETISKNGTESCGTGFFINFIQTDTEVTPAIVTNKHVIANAESGKFHLTLASTDGLPLQGQHQQFSLPDFEAQWILHPDPNVDLAAFLIGPLINKANQAGVKLFFVPLQVTLIPSDSERQMLSTMEEILMIGYPSGIWDQINNLPVIRRGITATHQSINWNGNTEFLTDIASFPGSSGSPVLLVNIGSYMDRMGNTFMGTHRIHLLGIHYAGFMHTAEGDMRIVTSPSSMATPFTRIPNNVGLAINSKRLLEFIPIISRIIGRAPAPISWSQFSSKN